MAAIVAGERHGHLDGTKYDRGASWISAGSFTPFDGTGDITPTIAANGDGQWIASWSSGGKIVFAESIDDGLTFSEPIDMSNGSGAATRRCIQPITER
ncbi:MAG: sialidase family protein [Phycisphaerae bacterium]